MLITLKRNNLIKAFENYKKDTENLKLYIQKNFKLIDEDIINAVCKKLLD